MLNSALGSGPPRRLSGEPLAANFLIISSEICRQYKILVFYELYDDFVCGTEIIWVFCMRKGILYGHYPHKSILYENLSCKSPLVHPAGNGAEEGLLVELALLFAKHTGKQRKHPLRRRRRWLQQNKDLDQLEPLCVRLHILFAKQSKNVTHAGPNPVGRDLRLLRQTSRRPVRTFIIRLTF